MLPAAERAIPDPHSLSNPDRVRVRHVAIDLTVRFDSRTLEGTADLDVERPTPGETALLMGTRALDVRRVEAGPAGGALAPARFRMDPEVPILGARLFLQSARRDLSLPSERAVDLGVWLDGPGVPPGAVPAQTDALDRVDELRTAWLAGRIGTAALPGGAWSTLEWLRFLRGLPADLPAPRRDELDGTFGIGARENAEIAFQWLLLAVQSGQEAAVSERLERFLVSIGHRQFVKPLFEELVRTPAGRRLALAIYGKARLGYHPLMVETVDRIVAWAP